MPTIINMRHAIFPPITSTLQDDSFIRVAKDLRQAKNIKKDCSYLEK